MAAEKTKPEKQWQKKRRELRDQLWADAKDVVFRREAGYCKVVPRVLPLIAVLADTLKTKSGSLTATLTDLWLRTDDDGFVEVDDEFECAAAAGFLGGRALWSWRDRIRELECLGLIRVAGEGNREIRYILLKRPELWVDEVMSKHASKVPKVWFDYYRRRVRDVGGKQPVISAA